ncbi:S-adenosyl-L-methionine-dependent methyltransferase, partial [Hyaloscypha finlandica]
QNGRRYHAYREGEYLFPNDESEQNRLDMLHHIFKLVLGGNLFKAPINEPLQRVLDFGTGTGIWAIDLADENPATQVQGTDLSPIQPIWVPPNLKFVVDDCESSWPEEDHSIYDFVHGRSMSGSIANWSALFTEALQALKPGGWLEMQEFDVWFRSEEGELPADSKIAEWQSYLDQASLMFGKRLNVANEFKEKMIEVGFEDVRDDIIKVPIGAWPKDLRLKEQGRWLQAQMLDSIEPISLGYCSRILKWSDAKTQVFMAGVRNEFLNHKTHLFVYCHFIHGRRP